MVHQQRIDAVSEVQEIEVERLAIEEDDAVTDALGVAGVVRGVSVVLRREGFDPRDGDVGGLGEVEGERGVGHADGQLGLWRVARGVVR